MTKIYRNLAKSYNYTREIFTKIFSKGLKTSGAFAKICANILAGVAMLVFILAAIVEYIGLIIEGKYGKNQEPFIVYEEDRITA